MREGGRLDVGGGGGARSELVARGLAAEDLDVDSERLLFEEGHLDGLKRA